MEELQCEKLSYPSADGQHTIAAYVYLPKEEPPRAVIQISHGMCEYIGRYRRMIEFFTAHGYAVAGNDHLGHGASVPAEEHGHFADKNGWRMILADLKTMNDLLHRRWPELPVVLFGHSMGSFFARWYAEFWPDTIRCLIVSGTAGPAARNNLGFAISSLAAGVAGPRYHSRVLIKSQVAGYCSRFPDATSKNAWISREPQVVAEYDADPDCNFTFTAAAYRDMLQALTHVSSKKWAEAMPKDLPILLVAGTDDPVGDYGAGVREVYAMLGDAGVRDLTCEIYEGGRHEMHNETNNAEVFQMELGWLESRLFGDDDEPDGESSAV